ncbi:MAG: hypothetical protein JW795_14070 [Chitinivibrionales bacterium]|nr:hypothetical protein [Chitinivibrionales bacterium]
MNRGDLQTIAIENERRLSDNEYPGRGIIIGRSEEPDQLIQVYWIMGRSENSRNRVFEREDSSVRTRAFDATKLTDPTNIIYYPIRTCATHHIVSNGDQTDTIYTYLENGGTFQDACMSRQFEADAPHYTPRIAGIVDSRRDGCILSILKSINNDPQLPARSFFHYSSIPLGFGYCIHTYQHNGSILPPFQGEPLVVSVNGAHEAIATHYWQLLDRQNRISILVKSIDRRTNESKLHIINRHGQ